MASSIVSNLIAASALDGAEIYYGVQGSADRKVTGAQIKTHVSDSPTLITPTVVTSVTGAAGSDILFAGGAAANDTANAPAFNVTAADGGATSGNGGPINITSGAAIGSGFGTGGDIQFTAGFGSGGGFGGGFLLFAGSGGATGEGGTISVAAGLSGITSGGGGKAEVSSGTARGIGNGGLIDIFAGDGGLTSGNGGSIHLTGGDARASGDGGDIMLTPGTVTSGTVGHILLSAVEDFADDAAAATGGVPVSGVYRTASVLKIRVA